MDADLLARALCYGFSLSKVDLAKMNAEYNIRGGFIHGAVFIIDGKRPINTVINEDIAAPEKALKLRYSDGKMVADTADEEVTVSVISEPRSIKADSVDGKPASDFFSMHSPRTLFCTPLRECVFAVKNEICKFCTFESTAMKPLAPQVFSSHVGKISEELGFVPSVAIGAGTPNKNDHGAKYFGELVRVLKEDHGADVSIEMVPPHDFDDLSKMIDCGVDSVIMSLELWNDERRTLYCPGKSYVSKEKYLAAHDLVQDRLGPGSSSSVLIYGLEPHEDTARGIIELTSRKIVPTIIPFRPYSGTQLESFGYTDFEGYKKVSALNRMLMKSEGIDPARQKGCTECGGCSIDIIPA
jgi:hypothetical protein